MSDEIRSTTPRPRFRYVIDLDGGQRWMVEEREFHGCRSLFFIRDGGFVRQRKFPRNWADLPDADVLALLPVSGDAPDRSDGAPAGHSGPSAPPARRVRILVIDDSAADRYVAKRMFERETAEVFEAADPLVGIEIARMLHPDLVLLDYKLPGMSGAAVIRKLKSDPLLANVAVLLYTGYVEGVAPDARALSGGVIDKGSFTRANVAPLIASVIQT